MAIYYYTNTSPGAPTLTGAAGSLITLLDWLLVTNLGWTKEFSGTNLASYRAATGNRFYLGVDDTTALYSRVRGFATMTAGFEKFSLYGFSLKIFTDGDNRTGRNEKTERNL